MMRLRFGVCPFPAVEFVMVDGARMPMCADHKRLTERLDAQLGDFMRAYDGVGGGKRS